MSENAIVEKLMRNHRKLEFLEEDVMYLYEADDDEDEDTTGADEEYAALNDEDAEESDADLDAEDTEEDEIDDDSTAPEQGSPDDEEPESDDIDLPSMPSGGGGSHASAPSASDDAEMPQDEAPEEPMDPDVKTYDNPLDNNYAIRFTLDDSVNLLISGDSTTEKKSGVIDGYDTEGFYRVKWNDGTSTSGLTDIALEEFVRAPKAKKTEGVVESVCVCGSHNIINEDNQMICDDCGRLFEGALDALTVADKSRPKGKRMIRSMAHPVSTAVKPNIAGTITEDDDPAEEKLAFDDIKQLDGDFWTRQEDLTFDIEELGYDVEEITDEYIVVSSSEDDENVYKIPIVGTSRSFSLDFSKARMI